MANVKISSLPAATSVTDDDLLVIVDDPSGIPETQKITVADFRGSFPTVEGPGSATDNAVARFDGATGTLIQNSGVIVSDTDDVTGMATLTLPNTGLHLLDTNASHDLIIAPGSDLTADRTLTISTGDSSRTIAIGGNISTSGNFTFAGAGAYDLTFALGASTTLTLPISGTLVTTSNNLSVFASTTSSQLRGVISDETGSGLLVFNDAPTLIAPSLGVATASTINKVTITAPATNATLTLAQGSSLITSGANAITLTSTGTTSVTLPTTGTLSTLAGSESLSNKSLVTPTIASFANANHNHTNSAGGGALTSAAISDFDSQVRTSRLDQMANPNASVSMNSQKIVNLLDPTSAQDASTKAYTDSIASGYLTKAPCRLASTADVPGTYVGSPTFTLTAAGFGALSVDGVTPSVADRILLKNQTTGTQNGIYTVTVVGNGGAAYVLTRATDYDSSGEILTGNNVFISAGSTQSSTGWTLITPATITLDTTSLSFVQSSNTVTYSAGSGLGLAGTVFSVTAGTGISVGSGVAVDTTVVATTTNSLTMSNKTLTTPTIASFTNATHTHANGVGGGTLDATVIFGSTAVPIANGGTAATSASAARTSLGLTIGSDVQAFNTGLTQIASAAASSDLTLYTSGVGTWGTTSFPSFGRTLVGSGGASSARSTLGVVIGTDVEAWDADLDALAALASTGIIARTGAAAYSLRTITGSQGVSVTNGDGVSGAPALAADINGLTTDSSPDSATDYVMTYDASATSNKKVLLSTALASAGGKDLSYFRQVGTSPFESWYSNQISGVTTTTVTFGVGLMRAVPFLSGRGGTLDRLAFSVTTGGTAGSVGRLGIYTSTSGTNLYPNTLLVDSGEFDCTTTGTKSATISQALTANSLYWMVFIFGVASPTLRGAFNYSIPPVLGNSSALNGTPNTYLSVSQAYGALPATFTAGATMVIGSTPLPYVRYSA